MEPIYSGSLPALPPPVEARLDRIDYGTFSSFYEESGLGEIREVGIILAKRPKAARPP